MTFAKTMRIGMAERLSVFWHPDCLLHDTGAGVFEAAPSDLLAVAERHPEGPDRISNILSILRRGPLSGSLDWRSGREATRDELLTFHDARYIDGLERADREAGGRFTATTILNPGSLAAIRTAAGTAIAAADHLADGRDRKVYALVRPPGHHAAPGQADGYCFLNNAALAAERARRRGFERVAIVDWDVHHGNGTQEGFYERPDVLTVSLHMDHGSWGPSHPQTGAADEIGRGPGFGFNVNIPLPMGTSDSGYAAAFGRIVAPAVRDFAPDLLVVAAGFDASQFDPNGRQTVTTRGFHALGRAVAELAEELCGGRVLLVQEGGYNVSYTAFCAHACLEGVLGLEMSLPDPLAFLPDHSPGIREHLSSVEAAHRAALKRRSGSDPVPKPRPPSPTGASPSERSPGCLEGAYGVR